MTVEEKLKTKTYYQQFVDQDKDPAQQLGELLIRELKQEIPDASYIRFSQGEVYFHYKDYEAAIYKWEQITNELAPWARKNIADAYFALGQYDLAEEIYHSIETDSVILEMEIKFQLFNLYYQGEKLAEAGQVIKEAIELNPDYPNLTKIARMFFEETEDWASAVELAKREGLRTGSLVWFERLKSYVHRGFTATLPPEYFADVIPYIYSIDHDLFERFVMALWESYQDTEYFTNWLSVINKIFLHMDEHPRFPELARLYERTYQDLSGKNLTLEKVKPLIADFLTVWIRIVDGKRAMLPAAALFAWHDKVADSVDVEALRDAEQVLFHETWDTDITGQVEAIGTALIEWGNNHQLIVDQRLLAIHEILQRSDSLNIAIAGMGRRELFYPLFSEKDYVPTPLVPVLYQSGKETAIYEYGREFTRRIDRKLDAQTDGIKTDGRFFKKTIVHPVLEKANVSLLDFPEIYSVEHEALIEAMDAIVYFLSPKLDHFQDELLELKWLKKEYPDLIIHAVVARKNETIAEYREDVQKTIGQGKIYTYEQMKDFYNFFQEIRQTLGEKTETTNLQKIIVLMQRIIHDFLQQRVRAEHRLHESIQKKEDILQRLNGAHYQLTDLQTEIGERIANAFSLIKTDLEEDIAEELPKVLQGVAKEIPETIDPATLHVEVNKKMNEKIKVYLHGEILEQLTSRAEEWLVLAKEELEQGRAFLEEIENGFNRMLGEERLRLPCDFQVLDDWQRDVARFTTGSVIQEENILLRYTPGQILLKGAGKVLGNFARGKPFFIQQFKNFIASEDYHQVVTRVSKQFFALFTLMEQGLARDVSLFFADALKAIQQLIADLKREVVEERTELEQLRKNPEKFRDPLTLFEIRLLECRYLLEVEHPAKLTK